MGSLEQTKQQQLPQVERAPGGTSLSTAQDGTKLLDLQPRHAAGDRPPRALGGGRNEASGVPGETGRSPALRRRAKAFTACAPKEGQSLR